MLCFTVEAVPGTATPDRPQQWRCWADWEGQHYETVSRVSPIFDLCRVLRGAGVPDQAVEVIWGSRVALRIKSLYFAATRTLQESSGRSLREVAYQAYPDTIKANRP